MCKVHMFVLLIRPYIVFLMDILVATITDDPVCFVFN